MKQIVNVSQNWAIGKKGNLMITLAEDMKFFRETTKGMICIMGLKTLNSFPGKKPLKNRINIVLTHDEKRIDPVSFESAEEDQKQGKNTQLLCAHNKTEALRLIESYDNDDVFIIGGASIYRLFLDDCDCCLVTKNSLSDEGADTYYPNLDEDDSWQLTEQSDEYQDGDIHYRFCTYRRVTK